MICEQGNIKNVGMNLADLNLKYWHHVPMIIEYLKGLDVKKLAIGSSFCDIYFIKTLRMFQDSRNQFDSLQCEITLVIPHLGEMMYERMKEKILEMLPFFAEVVVNDFAMLRMFVNLREQGFYTGKITAGRLLIKNFRDMRYESYEKSKVTMFFPEYLKGKVDGVEMDVVAADMDFAEVPEDVAISLHYPYTYQTCSGACSYSAAANPTNLYSQRNMRCRTNCMNGYLHLDYGRGGMYLVGRGAYFENPPVRTMSRPVDFYWYWPLKEFLGTNPVAYEGQVFTE